MLLKKNWKIVFLRMEKEMRSIVGIFRVSGWLDNFNLAIIYGMFRFHDFYIHWGFAGLVSSVYLAQCSNAHLPHKGSRDRFPLEPFLFITV